MGLGEKVGEGDVQGAEGRGRGEGLRRGLKGEVGEYHNESNSCTSSHHSGAMPCNHPTSKASPYHTSPSLTPSYLTLLYPLATVQCPAHPTSKASAGAAKCEVIVIDASTGGVAPQLREYQAYCPTLGFYRLSTSVWQPHLDPTSSNSSNMLKIFWSSAFIFSLDI